MEKNHNNSIKSVEHNLCTGCGACSLKCPHKCIKMTNDKEGFLVPEVDENLCSNCGTCLKVCLTSSANALFNNCEQHYACSYAKDNEMLSKSSSGGVFGILARFFLKNGTVYGCKYNENMEAVHVRACDKQEIIEMYGSKYVQSKAFICFPDVKDDLLAGKNVLFSGTACQIAALKLYLEKDYENLFCVEILCHGVPSPKLFRNYKKYLENKLGGNIVNIQFRNKERYGWGSEHRTCVLYEKQNILKKYRPILPAYFSSFFYGMNLRESCYNCKFAKIERVADITIGDFWGSWAKYHNVFKNGISVISINNGKGEFLSKIIKENSGFYETLNRSEAIKSNGNFEHPVNRPYERNSFYANSENSYKGLWKKVYFSRTYRKKVIASVYGAFVPAKIRFFIQKVKYNIRLKLTKKKRSGEND